MQSPKTIPAVMLKVKLKAEVEASI